MFLGRLNTLSLSLGQTVSVACIPLSNPFICLYVCASLTSRRELHHHTPEVLRAWLKRDRSLIRTALPFRADEGSWPHFYYRCLTLMISSKHTVKDPDAFELCSPRFMALTSPSVPRKVSSHGLLSLHQRVQGVRDQGRKAVGAHEPEGWDMNSDSGEDSKTKWGKRRQESGGMCDSVSQLIGLESARQSIPAFRLGWQVLLHRHRASQGSTKSSTALNDFNDQSKRQTKSIILSDSRRHHWDSLRSELYWQQSLWRLIQLGQLQQNWT